MASKKNKGVRSAVDARTGKRVSAKTANRRPATTVVTVNHTRRLKRALNKILSLIDNANDERMSPGAAEAWFQIKKIAQEAL